MRIVQCHLLQISGLPCPLPSRTPQCEYLAGPLVLIFALETNQPKDFRSFSGEEINKGLVCFVPGKFLKSIAFHRIQHSQESVPVVTVAKHLTAFDGHNLAHRCRCFHRCLGFHPRFPSLHAVCEQYQRTVARSFASFLPRALPEVEPLHF
jgi:hypothetical protein